MDKAQSTLPVVWDIAACDVTRTRTELFRLDKFPIHLPGPEPDKALVESVREFGVIEPIVLIEWDGQDYLRDGVRRVKAARLVGLAQIEAKIYTLSPGFGPRFTLVLNNQRSHNPITEYEAIKDLLAQPGMTKERITQITGVPRATIDKRLYLGRLHPDLLRALADGTLKPGVAEACSKLGEQTQARLADVL